MGMQHPRAAVGALARKGQLRPVAVEAHAPFDELVDLSWPFFHEHAHCFLAAESVTGKERVVQVERHLIVLAQRHRYTPLGILGAGFIQLVLGENQDLPAACQFDSRPHPGDSTA